MISSQFKSAVAAEIRGGLDAYEFEPFFQPIVDLKDYSLAGFEALARWRHPARGLVKPIEFVGPAEENGLIRDLDSVILDRAWREFDQALETCDWQGPSMVLSVNLSTEHLMDSAVIDRVGALIAKGRGKKSRLQFEITETLLIENTDSAELILDRLKELGVSIAMDDFGTGYSSLVYLHRFPIDCIKIDRSFSKAILKSPRSLAIVRSIISLGRSMDLRIVAEGIEEEAVADRLLSLGCQYGQGIYFSHPVPQSRLLDCLQDAKAAALRDRLIL